MVLVTMRCVCHQHRLNFNFKGNGPASAPAATPTAANAETEKTTTAATDVAADGLSALTAMTADTAKKSNVLPGDTAGSVKQENAQVNADVNLWQPVIKELSAFNSTKDSTNSSLWSIFFMGVLGGFIALLTPCVWPIIPMTVSFFLKRAKDDRKKGIRDAVTYGLSIIVIYMGLATLVTWAFGPQKLNELATNAPFNVFFLPFVSSLLLSVSLDGLNFDCLLHGVTRLIIRLLRQQVCFLSSLWHSPCHW